MPALIQPTPRSQAWGVPADLLKKVQDFGETPFGLPNPPVKLLMEMFGVPAIQRTMDKLSYGEPITNLGKANVPLLPQDTAEAALSVVPGLGAAATKAPKLAVAGAKNLAVPRLQSKMASQLGAVRLGGQERAVASHSSPALPENIESIAQDGLYAPSIGLSRGAGNAYSPNSPSLVWRAGALDRHFPHEAPSVTYNRDAYVWNPSRGWDKSIKDQWDEYMAFDTVERRLSKLMGDTRLTQMLPDQHSQSAAIIASPSFKDLKSWEESPFGYGALPNPHDSADYGQRLADYQRKMSELRNGYGGLHPAGEEFLTRLAKLANADLSPEMMAGNYFGESYMAAKNAPSQLGELKIYAPSVPAGPGDASVYLPKSLGSPSRMSKLLDQGYEIYDPRHLAGLAGDPSVTSRTSATMPVHLLAPSTGKAPPSADEALRMYNDLQPPKLWQGAETSPEMKTLSGEVDEDGFMVLPPQIPAQATSELPSLIDLPTKVKNTFHDLTIKANSGKEFADENDQDKVFDAAIEHYITLKENMPDNFKELFKAHMKQVGAPEFYADDIIQTIEDAE